MPVYALQFVTPINFISPPKDWWWTLFQFQCIFPLVTGKNTVLQNHCISTPSPSGGFQIQPDPDSHQLWHCYCYGDRHPHNHAVPNQYPHPHNAQGRGCASSVKYSGWSNFTVFEIFFSIWHDPDYLMQFFQLFLYFFVLFFLLESNFVKFVLI